MDLKNKIQVFKKNKRALISIWLLGIIFVLSLFSDLIANDKPLIVKYKNELYFPIIHNYSDAFWGGDFPTAADYRDNLIQSNKNNK